MPRHGGEPPSAQHPACGHAEVWSCPEAALHLPGSHCRRASTSGCRSRHRMHTWRSGVKHPRPWSLHRCQCRETVQPKDVHHAELSCTHWNQLGGELYTLGVVLAVVSAVDAASVLYDYNLCCADTVYGQHVTANSMDAWQPFRDNHHDIPSDDMGMLALPG